MKEIDLKFNRKDFEEIFFNDDKGNYLKSPTTKVYFKYFIISLMAFIGASIYSLARNEYGFFVIGLIAFLVCLYFFLKAILDLRKWKREIKDYLDREEKFKSNKLILSDKFLSIKQDDNETVEEWSTINSAHISDNYIRLDGKVNVLIPSKTMSTDEYKELRKILSDKLHSQQITI